MIFNFDDTIFELPIPPLGLTLSPVLMSLPISL